MCNNSKIRQELISTAQSWLDTKFEHQGRQKRTNDSLGGCDCIGLIIEVAKSLNLKDRHNVDISLHDFTNYAPYPKDNRLKETLDDKLYSISQDKIKIGDIILFKIEKLPQHVALIGEYNKNYKSMIHSYLPAGKVVEHLLDERWIKRIVQCYSFFKN